MAGKEGCALTRPWGPGGPGELTNTRWGWGEVGERTSRAGFPSPQGQDLWQRELWGAGEGVSVPLGSRTAHSSGPDQYCLNQNPSLDRYGQKPLPFDSL